jgi:hypothetical protein
MGIKKLALTVIFLSFLSACLVKPPIVLQYGGVLQENYRDTIDIEVRNRLIFIPVTINQKKYKFLFDTGAPFSISKEIQKEFEFNVISKGNIVDSDHNRAKIDYVSVSEIGIGGVDFIDQTAFVGDFKASMVLECMGIDGIVGSNLIRHADWLIDLSQEVFIIGNDLDEAFAQMQTAQSFTSDFQYNIDLDLKLGSEVFKKITLDYGSNGGLDLRKSQFNNLESHHLLNKGYEVVGKKQTGLLGEVVQAKQIISVSDSLSLGELPLSNIEVEIGGNDVFGTQVLEKLIVGINWKAKKLHFSPSGNYHKTLRSYGFYSGPSADGGLVIRSVLKDGQADQAGLSAGMLVDKINELDFENGNDYCDYIKLVDKTPDSLVMEVRIDSLERRKVVLSYSILE